MSFGRPRTPRIPPPPPPPDPNKSPEALQARADQVRALRSARGFGSTIATTGVLTRAGAGQLV